MHGKSQNPAGLTVDSAPQLLFWVQPACADEEGWAMPLAPPGPTERQHSGSGTERFTPHHTQGQGSGSRPTLGAMQASCARKPLSSVFCGRKTAGNDCAKRTRSVFNSRRGGSPPLHCACLEHAGRV